MNVQAVVGILALVGVTFSTLWATGGWHALRRRSIQQELDLAKDLPSSASKARLTTHVEQEIDIYLSRIRHEQSSQVRLPTTGVFLVIVIDTVTLQLFPDPPRFVGYTLGSLIFASSLWFYAVGARWLWIKRSRRRHDHLLQAARGVAPTAGASEGRKKRQSRR